MTEITQEKLKKLVSYDPDSGVFLWVAKVAHNVKIGDVAGWSAGRGYRVIMIDSRAYPAHRLAFLYMTGAFPPNHVDHVNGCTSDNRWINLRAVTPTENGRNQRTPKNNTSGVIGVSWHKQSKKWVVRIMFEGKKKHVGIFADKKDAVRARAAAEIRYGYHPNHGRA